MLSSSVLKRFMAEPMVSVTLCWSLAPRHVHEMAVLVPPGSTVQAVLDQGVAKGLNADAVLQEALHVMQPAIWGRKVAWTHSVKEGDRVELCRPLKVDPMVARRQRFKRQGKGRTGLFANRKSGSAAGY